MVVLCSEVECVGACVVLVTAIQYSVPARLGKGQGAK